MKTFDFTQETPSAEWVIVHNLNAYPVTETRIQIGGQSKKILPGVVEYMDENTVRVTFSAPHAGDARLVG